MALDWTWTLEVVVPSLGSLSAVQATGSASPAKTGRQNKAPPLDARRDATGCEPFIFLCFGAITTTPLVRGYTDPNSIHKAPRMHTHTLVHLSWNQHKIKRGGKGGRRTQN